MPTGYDPMTVRRAVPYERLRVGEYRVIFKIVGDTLIVTDVGPRGGVYSD